MRSQACLLVVLFSSQVGSGTCRLVLGSGVFCVCPGAILLLAYTTVGMNRRIPRTATGVRWVWQYSCFGWENSVADTSTARDAECSEEEQPASPSSQYRIDLYRPRATGESTRMGCFSCWPGTNSTALSRRASVTVTCISSRLKTLDNCSLPPRGSASMSRLVSV